MPDRSSSVTSLRSFPNGSDGVPRRVEALVALYLAGCVVAIPTLVWTSAQSVDHRTLWVLIATAAVGLVGLVIARGRAGTVACSLLAGYATIAIGVADLAAHDGVSYVAFLLWVVVYAAVYLPTPVVVVLAAVMVAEVVGGVQAAADPPDRVAFCVTMAAMLIGTAVVVRLLQRRIVQLVTILADVARTDALTNCGNRRAFHERLAEVHARGRRGGPTPIVILVDLDDLKAINDRGGHPAGDAVLTAAGAALAGEVRAGEAAFRIGGDEFAVIATSDDPAAIDALSDRFARALAGVDVAAALGASSSESRIEHPDDLVARADRALYAAKARRQRPPTPA